MSKRKKLRATKRERDPLEDVAAALRPIQRLAQGPRGLALVTVLVVAAIVLASTAVSRKSVTTDEYMAVPLGSAMLETRDFHLATSNPLLSYVLEAAPLLFTSAKIETAEFSQASTVWRWARMFVEANWEQFHHYCQLGRAVSLGFLALTLFLAYGLARSLYGPVGGLIAAAFASFCPNLLAHGPLATPDIYLTAGIVGSLWAFDWLLRKPGWAPACALGFAMGAASLCKFTAVLLFGILPAVALGLWVWPPANRHPGESAPWVLGRRTWFWGAGAVAVGVFVINAGYLFDGSFTLLGTYPFQTEPFQSLQRVLPGWLPVPLPFYYFLGWDVQLGGEERYLSYLLGRFSIEGFPHYYVVGLLVKTPSPVLLLTALAWLCGGLPTRREVPMLATAAALLAFFSFGSHKNIGVRYVLFLFPLMSVWIGRLTGAKLWRTGHPPKVALAVGAAALWLFVNALVTWPDYIAYFNLVSGGPANGHTYLLDSNLDWGQDLIALREYMDREKIESVDLAYFGRVKPEMYGVRYTDLFGRPQQRYVAISANLLWGRIYFVNGGTRWLKDKDTYAYLRGLKPKTVLGHSIYVYDLQG